MLGTRQWIFLQRGTWLTVSKSLIISMETTMHYDSCQWVKARDIIGWHAFLLFWSVRKLISTWFGTYSRSNPGSKKIQAAKYRKCRKYNLMNEWVSTLEKTWAVLKSMFPGVIPRLSYVSRGHYKVLRHGYSQ
mgnify:CR=1 FL=1